MLNIRPAVAADIPLMLELQRQAVTAAQWRREQYQRIFTGAAPRRLALLAEEDGAAVGFLVAAAGGEDWELENMVVAAGARQRGVGSRLLRELLEQAQRAAAKSVFLEVRESNQAARALYENAAFRNRGRRPGYYRNPDEDALVYRCDISGGGAEAASENG